MNHKIPKYLTEKKNVVGLLIFTALFSLIFINLYRPFGSASWLFNWGNVTSNLGTIYFLSSSLIVLAAILILTASRMVMCKISKKNTLTYWQYFLWIFVEIAIIALIYSFLTKFVVGNKDDFMQLFLFSFLYTALVLFLPYTVSWLYFALRDTEKTLEKVVKAENFVDFSTEKEDLVNFKDEKGILRLSVKLSNLIFIESSDNYVEIYYLNQEKSTKFLLRNSLKNIEEQYASPTLVRCHRSYMINLKKVRVMRKDKEGIFLEMDTHELTDIPVSKTYSGNVLNYFGS